MSDKWRARKYVLQHRNVHLRRGRTPTVVEDARTVETGIFEKYTGWRFEIDLDEGGINTDLVDFTQHSSPKRIVTESTHPADTMSEPG
jgi:hypothetical protein